MTSIYLTLVWFGGLFKDPDSRNNEEIQANITQLPNRVVLNGALAKNLIFDFLIFPPHRFPNITIFKEIKNWNNQLLYNREILEVLDVILFGTYRKAI